MLDERYLLLGLDGLCVAHRHDYFQDGHLAASVLAAYHLAGENGLDARTSAAIQSHIDDDLRDSPVFTLAPDQEPDGSLMGNVLDALLPGAGDLRQVGHNVIFSAAALKAFEQRPSTVTPFRVEGICSLITSFETTQNVPLPDRDAIPRVADRAAFVHFLFEEDDVADRAFHAFQMYVATERSGPRNTDREIPEHKPQEYTPLEYEYWRRRKSVRSGLGHAFKYAYSFYALLGELDNGELKEQSLAESYRIF